MSTTTEPSPVLASAVATVPYLIPASTGEVLNYGNMTSDQVASTPNAVQITAAQYATLLAGGRYFWAANTLTAISATAPIAQAQAAASSSVDVAAENCRQLFLTSGAGQAMVYLIKAQEADAFLALYPTQAVAAAASPPIVTTTWPLLSAEVGVTGPDLFTVAMVVSGVQAEWVSIAAQIEHLRLNAKMVIAAATTIAAINTALAITWPTVAIP